MTPSPEWPRDALPPGILALLDRLGDTPGFPAAAVLESLRVARAVAETSSTGNSAGAETWGLLAGLHLDLAAVEIAAATGLDPPELGGDRHGERGEVAASSAGRLLVECCARVVQDCLDPCSGVVPAADLSPEQQLACTRAVLHLDAARRAWPRDVSRERVR